MSNEYIKINEYWYLMNRIAYWLINNNKKFNTRNLYGYFDRVADYGTIVNVIKERGTKYGDDALIAEFTECAIYDNKDLSFLPNYVTGSNGVKYYTNTFVSMANRVSAYEVLHGVSPKIVYIQKENSTSENTDAVLDEFEKYFGVCKTIDDALLAIRYRGYAFYFNSQVNTVNTIIRVAKKLGANCTDISQLFYRLSLGMNKKYGTHYEPQFVHVMCKSGVGHVRLRFKNGGNWFYRDPAAVLDGESVTSNWCSDGRIIAYNPSWIFDDLYQ